MSLNTYIVALFGTVFALANGMPLNLIVWLHLFSLMQLVEYFLWKNLTIPSRNRVFSGIGLLILALEPVASAFLLAAGHVRNAFLGGYLVFLLAIVAAYYPWTPYTKVASNGHLLWMWQPTKMPFYVNILWAVFFLTPLFLAKYYIIGIFGILTILISIYTYKHFGTWGTMWCWIANAIWLFIIGYIASDACFKGLYCKKDLSTPRV